MIALEVSNEELLGRLLLRGKDSGRPDDANPEIIARRIEEYNNKTTQVASYYKAQDKFSSINGVGDVNDIFASIGKVISDL